MACANKHACVLVCARDCVRIAMTAGTTPVSTVYLQCRAVVPEYWRTAQWMFVAVANNHTHTTNDNLDITWTFLSSEKHLCFYSKSLESNRKLSLSLDFLC